MRHLSLFALLYTFLFAISFTVAAHAVEGDDSKTEASVQLHMTKNYTCTLINNGTSDIIVRGYSNKNGDVDECEQGE